ncbi:hypothetical protein C8J57DRAFT_1235529 [Mycena rebaudengoi]|nr:hypothetical protein C8J57DRAFT_1235529 [Mycena rebaudengoi]
MEWRFKTSDMVGLNAFHIPMVDVEVFVLALATTFRQPVLMFRIGTSQDVKFSGWFWRLLLLPPESSHGPAASHAFCLQSLPLFYRKLFRGHDYKRWRQSVNREAAALKCRSTMFEYSHPTIPGEVKQTGNRAHRALKPDLLVTSSWNHVELTGDAAKFSASIRPYIDLQTLAVATLPADVAYTARTTYSS